MKKIFEVTISGKPFYFAGKDLAEVVKNYPQASKIELFADKIVINSGDRYDLLMECLEFIQLGANSQTNEKRVELEDKIKLCLKVEL